MMSYKTQVAIIENIQAFNKFDLKTFHAALAEETTDRQDLCDMINVKCPDDYNRLDTAVRDCYMNAFLKMHIS